MMIRVTLNRCDILVAITIAHAAISSCSCSGCSQVSSIVVIAVGTTTSIIATCIIQVRWVGCSEVRLNCSFSFAAAVHATTAIAMLGPLRNTQQLLLQHELVEAAIILQYGARLGQAPAAGVGPAPAIRSQRYGAGHQRSAVNSTACHCARRQRFHVLQEARAAEGVLRMRHKLIGCVRSAVARHSGSLRDIIVASLATHHRGACSGWLRALSRHLRPQLSLLSARCEQLPVVAVGRPAAVDTLQRGFTVDWRLRADPSSEYECL